MNVRIDDEESFVWITIETRKYRRYTSISKRKPFIKTIDMKNDFERKKTFFRFRNEWIEGKKFRELVNTGTLKAYIQNSPKLQRFRG